MIATNPARMDDYLLNGVPLRWIHFTPPPVVPRFDGLPLTTGEVYRPESWPGPKEFSSKVAKSDFVVVDRLEASFVERAILSAYETGRFVIAPHSTYNEWLIRDGETGRLGGSATCIASIMEDLAQRPETVAALTSGARRWAQANSIRSMVDGFMKGCLLYTSPSPRDGLLSRMPSSA